MIALWATLSASAQTMCGDDTPGVVDTAIAALDAAYASVDEAAFDRASKNLEAAIACLDRTPAPVQIARLHQAMALASYVNGQTRASRRSLAAARLMDPGWKLTDDLFPSGHPYRALWAEATDPGPVETIGKIAPDAWIVDGVPRDEAPTERAFLLQVRQGDAIAWSGYLWSFDEIPDRGQSRQRSPLETPRDWSVAAGLHGRVLSSRQVAEVPTVWQDQSGTAVGGGIDLLARATPLTVVGFEAGGSLTGPVDPVAGAGGQPSAHAVVLLGGGGWVGAVQPWGAVRLGGAVDRLRAWYGPEDPTVATIGSAVAGLEGGARSARWTSGLAVDGLFASLRTPYQLRVRADGGALVSGPLAVGGDLELRAGGQSYVDADGSPVGSRRDTDVRLGVTLAVWE